MTEQLNTETAPPARRATLLDLSLTQLIAGSLAAATAAFLGSRIGWVGTITGAAIGSVVSAVTSSLYTASMTRAREAVRRQKPHTRPEPSTVQHAPAASQSSVPNAPVRTPRRVLATAGVLFAVAAAFLTGLQLATGADVTGTSLGPRQSTTEVQQGAPSGVEKPDPAAPSTEPSATPESTSPATRKAPAPEPTDASGVTAPLDSTDPATPMPTETVSPDPATSETPTQPTNPVDPTTPAG